MATPPVNETQLNWPLVKQWAENEIVRLRERNDSVELDPTQTSVVRGEIRALKRLIALPKTQAEQANPAPPGWPGDSEI